MSFEKLLFVGVLLAVVLIFAGWAIDQPDELDELEQEQALYCEMVSIHKATGGEYGWPDYKGVYAEACK